jgi:hypothetical protein
MPSATGNYSAAQNTAAQHSEGGKVPEEIRLAGRLQRLLTIGLAVMGVVFVAILSYRDGRSSVLGVLRFAIIFLDIAAILFLNSFLRARVLLISDDGITRRTMGKSQTISWDQIAAYDVDEQHDTTFHLKDGSGTTLMSIDCNFAETRDIDVLSTTLATTMSRRNREEKKRHKTEKK